MSSFGKKILGKAKFALGITPKSPRFNRSRERKRRFSQVGASQSWESPLSKRVYNHGTWVGNSYPK